MIYMNIYSCQRTMIIFQNLKFHARSGQSSARNPVDYVKIMATEKLVDLISFEQEYLEQEYLEGLEGFKLILFV